MKWLVTVLLIGFAPIAILHAQQKQPNSRREARATGGDGWIALPLARRIAADRHRSFAEKRRDLVEGIRRQVREADPALDDAQFERVLSIIGAIPREEFVSRAARPYAYLPTPLQIGYGQTISDAYIQAIMTAELRLPPNAEVLDVGTGSRYQAALLAPLARRVSSIEIVKGLADEAAARLRRLGYRNIEVRAGDGFAGWPEHAPFDGIVVAAGAAAVPQPLLDQLKPGGRLVMPVGPSGAQEQLLVYSKRADGEVRRCSLGWTMFVPLTGTGERAADSRGLIDRGIPSCHAQPLT
ncbi:protein-L-isoaspartate(D-aspartate) O-methyltransferase [Sphingomonas sp. A2-49]|uniref:protein-L-isoaspartate(D-aspartate) O-methyltransferase n=1 Tax=Sphingomonas sp. A2-49 TaxID=1391375 RepID=UPI0021D33E63|nr:protein-L-isoaspartate(D-aspartate) O-methyltransferase [Sphingomonas sp. A2-49]MCU6453402.1 protein-L-isoaspartate(D-aspartate) O-methyltransferase [Sphingomonas sp. A2-49]